MTVRLYFHFRSPYSWLAVERLAMDPIGLFVVPSSGIPESLDPSAGPSPRLAYIVEDVGRITARLGLPFKLPQPFDTDWIRPNAALWRAQEQGHGFAFMVAAFHQRYRHGRDLGQADVIADAAADAGLDAQPLVDAMDDASAQADVSEAAKGFQSDGVCGVPFFIYEGQKFWGQDRLPDLRAAMGLPQVPTDFERVTSA